VIKLHEESVLLDAATPDSSRQGASVMNDVVLWFFAMAPIVGSRISSQKGAAVAHRVAGGTPIGQGRPRHIVRDLRTLRSPGPGS
jgi:hypothetical protein